MKTFKVIFVVIAAGIILASCDDLIGDEAKLSVEPVHGALLEQTVGAEELVAEGVSFTTTGAWTSQVVPVSTKASQPMWVSISPDHGDEAGTYTITIDLEANDTGRDRKADIIISCGDQMIIISITQVAAPEVPSQEEDRTPQYKKYVSKLEWTFTDYDGESEQDVLEFAYDESDRVVRMTRNYSNSEYDGEQNVWTFNYAIMGEVGLTGVDTDPYHGTMTYTLNATLDNAGRVTKYVVAGDDGATLDMNTTKMVTCQHIYMANTMLEMLLWRVESNLSILMVFGQQSNISAMTADIRSMHRKRLRI